MTTKLLSGGLAFGIVCFISISLQAQVSITNSYLLHPESAIPIADTTAKFWFDSFDDEEGAFFTNVAKNGQPTDDLKEMITQSQNAYGMARAFQLTGDTTYLDYGRRALEWMVANSWDTTYGGWLRTQNNGNTKHAMDQHYANIGPSAMYEVTHDTTYWNILMDSYNIAQENLWDSRSNRAFDYSGYYESADLDWSNKNGKAFSATMDAITTHALYLYLMTKDEQYKTRLIQLADNVVDHFIPSMQYHQFGFSEVYDSDWQNGQRFDFTGHITKTAWCLARIYQIEPKPEYLEGAQTILNDVLEHKQSYNNKISQWWEYEEGFTSGIMNYYLSENENYLQYADDQLSMMIDNLWDEEYGEFYFFNDTEQNKHKGSYYKTSYHSVEMFFYIYLYTNLYLYDEPVSLYYHFAPTDEPRDISLYPLAFTDSLLSITDVSLNGETYTSFDGSTRTLSIAANEGGIFKVTFAPTGKPAITSIEEERSLAETFSLSQNYPNPFNPATNIEYQLNATGNVVLTVYNLLGKEVATLVNETQTAGEHSVTFDAQYLPSGMYVYRLQFGSQTETRKMMLIK